MLPSIFFKFLKLKQGVEIRQMIIVSVYFALEGDFLRTVFGQKIMDS